MQTCVSKVSGGFLACVCQVFFAAASAQRAFDSVYQQSLAAACGPSSNHLQQRLLSMLLSWVHIFCSFKAYSL